jgi:hypothetical protein
VVIAERRESDIECDSIALGIQIVTANPTLFPCKAREAIVVRRRSAGLTGFIWRSSPV